MSLSQNVLDFVKSHRAELALSIYLDGSATDPAERRHWRLELREQLTRARAAVHEAPAMERDEFERCVSALLERLPTDGHMLGSPGWAGFACVGGDVRVDALPVRTTTLVVWRQGPFVVPLLSADVTHGALVVRIDWDGANVWRMADGAIVQVQAVETHGPAEPGPHMGDAARAGFHGGTRGSTMTDEMQRQRDRARERLLETVAHDVALRSRGDAAIVIGGAPEAVARLHAALPAGVAARATVAHDLHMRTPHGEMLDIARAACEEVNERLQMHRLETWERHARTGGRAAVGLEAIAAAVIAGAAEHVMVSRQLCIDDPARVEDIVHLALVSGARVETAAHLAGERLDAVAGGIAAELRYLPSLLPDDAAAPRALVSR